jgi:hypothetical protein
VKDAIMIAKAVMNKIGARRAKITSYCITTLALLIVLLGCMLQQNQIMTKKLAIFVIAPVILALVRRRGNVLNARKDISFMKDLVKSLAQKDMHLMKIRVNAHLARKDVQSARLLNMIRLRTRFTRYAHDVKKIGNWSVTFQQIPYLIIIGT